MPGKSRRSSSAAASATSAASIWPAVSSSSWASISRVLYVRGEVPAGHVRAGIAVEEAGADDQAALRELLTPYCEQFALSVEELLKTPFTKMTSQTTRPYGQLYAD